MLNCTYLFSNVLSYKDYDLLSLVMIATIIGLCFYTVKQTLYRDIGLLFLTFGGLGNVINREFITKACVYDPFSFFRLVHFNVYDILISLGVAVVTFSMYTGRDDQLNSN